MRWFETSEESEEIGTDDVYRIITRAHPGYHHTSRSTDGC